MNKIFKVIWNQSLGAWVAVSELAKGYSKSSSLSSDFNNKLEKVSFNLSKVAISFLALGTAGFSMASSVEGGTAPYGTIAISESGSLGTQSGSSRITKSQVYGDGISNSPDEANNFNARGSIAIGGAAFVSRTIEAIALGRSATVDSSLDSTAGSIALGAYSVSGPINTGNETKSLTINNTTYTYAGQPTNDAKTSVLSIGSGSSYGKGGLSAGSSNTRIYQYRQIQNVAAGRVAENSTDAINGSQLYAVVNALDNINTNTDHLKDFVVGADKNHSAGGINVNKNNNRFDVISGNDTYLTTSVDGNNIKVDLSQSSKNAIDNVKKNAQKISNNAQYITKNAQNITNITNEVAKGWNLNTSKSGTGSVTNPSLEKINMGETVTLDAGNNINITQSGNKISVATSMTPTFTNVTTSGLTVNPNGNVNFGGNRLANVGTPIENTDAANKKYVDDGRTTVNSTDKSVNVTKSGQNPANYDLAVNMTKVANDVNLKYSADNNTNGENKLSERVNFNGSDLITTKAENGKISFDLSDNATFGLNTQNGNVSKKVGNTIDIEGYNSNINTLVQDGKVKVNLNNILNLTNAGRVTLGDTVLSSNGLVINNGPKVTKEGINAGNKNVTNVAKGTNGTDAVNLEQLNASAASSKTEVKAGNNVNVTKTSGTDGHDIYTVNVNTSTVSNGSDKIKITPTDKSNNVTNYVVDLSDKTKAQLAKEESVNATGSNVVVTENGVNNTGGKNYSVSLNNTLNLTDAGSVRLGNTSLNKDGLTITRGPSVTKDGINAGNKNITNVANGTNDTDAVNLSQLNATNQNITNIATEVAKGWNLNTSKSGTGSVTNSSLEKINMDETVTLDASNNINITQSGNKISIATSMTPTFTSVTTGSLTVNPNGNVNFGGNRLTNVGTPTADMDAANKKYVDDGRTTVNSTDKSVNVSKSGQNPANYDLSVNMTKVANDVNLKYRADNGNGTNKLSEEVKFKGSDYINTTAKNGEIGFDLSQTAKNKLDNAVQNFTVGADKNNQATGLNITNGGRFDIVGKEGEYIETSVDGKNITVGLNDNATSAIEKAHKGFGLKAGDGQNVTHQLGETIEVVGGNNNLNTSVADGKVKINLNNTLDLTNAGSVKLGDTTLNNDGLTIANGPSITKVGINAGSKQITNVAAGVNGTDAVNLDQLKESITNSISTEKVVKKAGDDNIAIVTTQSNKPAGEKGETYEVSVSKNAVKDASREAVKVTGSDVITVTPTKNATNHTTTYEVAYNGTKAAEVTNITYKANGANGQSVSLKDGLNFVNGTYTTASVGADGEVKYDVNVGAIINGTDGKPGVNGKDGLTTVQTVVDAINKSGWFANATSSVGGKLDGSSTATKVKPGSVVNFDAGKNLTVKQALDRDNHTYTYSLDKDIEVETVVVTGKDGKDGTIGLNGKDGTKGKNGTSRVDIKVAKGVDGVDGKHGVDGISRIVYEDGKGNHTVATLEDGLKFAGDDGSDETKIIKKKLNETLNITGGAAKDSLTDGNIGVNNNNGTLEVKLSKTLNLTDTGGVTIGNSTLNNGGLTITNGPSITQGGINVGNKTITNVANGTIGTDAVNLDQLNASTATSKTEVKSGNNVNVTKETGANGQTVYTVNANTSTVSNGSSKIKVTPTDKGNNVTDYAVDLSDDAKAQLAKEESVNATGLNVIVTESGVNGTGGKNYAVSLNNTLNLTDAGSVTISDTVLNSSGLTIMGGPSITQSGINAGDKKITNVSEGTVSADSKDAVNGSQLYVVTQNLTNVTNEVAKGWNITTSKSGTGNVSGTTLEQINIGETVTIDAGDNINITQTNGKISISTSDTPTFSNVTVGKDGKDGVDGQIGVNGKDGSSVVINGKDGSIGLNGKDGANGLTIKSADGKAGVDGKDGESKTRIVYETKDPQDPNKTITEEVATLNDGLKFKGDKGDSIAKKLNEELEILGKLNANANVTDKNLRVDNENGKLVLKMAKELRDLTNAQFIDEITGSKSIINGSGLTITPKDAPTNKIVSVTDKGLNNGGNQIVNIDSGLKDANGNKVSLTDAKGDTLNNAVNVGDLKESISNITDPSKGGGFGLTDENGNDVKTKLGETVTVKGDGSVITKVIDENGKTKLQVGLNKDVTIGNDQESGSITVKGENGQDGISINGKDGAIGLKGADDKDGIALNGKDGTIGINGKDGSSGAITVAQGQAGLDGNDGKDGKTKTRIVYEKSNGETEEVATLNDGLRFTGNNEVINNHKLNSVVTIKGEGVDKDASNNFESAAGNINVKANGKGTLEVQLAKDLKNVDSISNKDGQKIEFKAGGTTISGGNVSVDGNKITNVKAGEGDTDAVNVKQLKDGIAQATTKVDAGKNIEVSPTKNADGSTTYTVKTKDNVDFTSVTTGNTTMNDSGITIRASDNGKTSVTLTNKGLDNGGNKVVNVADGEISSTSKDAVNGSQLHNVQQELAREGLNFKGQSGQIIHKNLGETLEIVGKGEKADTEYDAVNIKTYEENGKVVVALAKDLTANKVTVGEKGANGKDGADGSIGVNGKDGSAVVINGKDGSIGLNGKDGKNGISIKGQDGKVGVDGKDGETRLVYVEKNNPNKTHEIATTDDGLKFTGNNEVVNSHKLNSKVTVKGEGISKSQSENFKSAKGNINVKADGKGTLEVQLAKNLDLGNDGSVRAGNTVVNNRGISVKSGPSMTSDGINAGNKKITHVAPGEVSATSTDAVNGSQLYAVNRNINNINNNVNSLNNKINKVDKELRAGIAGAAAIAGLPQVRGNGKSMVAVAASNYRGENAVALGYTKASDNGKVLLKLSGSTNTRGDVVSAVGLGYEW